MHDNIEKEYKKIAIELMQNNYKARDALLKRLITYHIKLRKEHNYIASDMIREFLLQEGIPSKDLQYGRN